MTVTHRAISDNLMVWGGILRRWSVRLFGTLLSAAGGRRCNCHGKLGASRVCPIGALPHDTPGRVVPLRSSKPAGHCLHHNRDGKRCMLHRLSMIHAYRAENQPLAASGHRTFPHPPAGIHLPGPKQMHGSGKQLTPGPKTEKKQNETLTESTPASTNISVSKPLPICPLNHRSKLATQRCPGKEK